MTTDKPATTVESLVKQAHQMVADDNTLTKAQKALLNKALTVAQSSEAKVAKRQAVFFSISKLPTTENKDKAFDYVGKNSNSTYMIDHTDVGKKLEDMKLFDKVPYQLAYMPWFVASARYADSAKGDVHAQWNNAHPESTSMKIEAPHLIASPNVKTINGQDKTAFIKKTIAKRDPACWKTICSEAKALKTAQTGALVLAAGKHKATRS